MKKAYKLVVLPEEMTIFVDTSSLGLDDYRGIYNSDHKKYGISYLKADTLRLEQLTEKLSKMNNWRVIKEVLEEFEEGNRIYDIRARKITCRQVAFAFKKALAQREQTLVSLRAPSRIASLNGELAELANKYSPAVEELFVKSGGAASKRKTDTKIINLALAYSNFQSVCVFANDIDLLTTFVDCSKKFGLAGSAYILTDRFHEARKTTDVETSGGELSL